jgi:hypothetical protein
MGHRPNRHRGESHHKRLAKRAAERQAAAEQERENEARRSAEPVQADAGAVLAGQNKAEA